VQSDRSAEKREGIQNETYQRFCRKGVQTKSPKDRILIIIIKRKKKAEESEAESAKRSRRGSILSSDLPAVVPYPTLNRYEQVCVCAIERQTDRERGRFREFQPVVRPCECWSRNRRRGSRCRRDEGESEQEQDERHRWKSLLGNAEHRRILYIYCTHMYIYTSPYTYTYGTSRKPPKYVFVYV
jgi:hypothetical protein